MSTKLQETNELDLDLDNEDLEIAYESIINDYNKAKELDDKNVLALETYFEVSKNLKAAKELSLEKQSKVINIAKETLQEFNFTSTGFATESFTDLSLAIEALDNEINTKIIDAQKASAGILSRMTDNVASFFGIVGRFNTRIARAQKDINNLKDNGVSKSINLSFKGKNFYTYKNGQLEGKDVISKLKSNLDILSNLTANAHEGVIRISNSEKGLWKLLTNENEYENIFFQNYEEYLDSFFDKVVNSLKPEAKDSKGIFEIMVNRDFLSGYCIKIVYPNKENTPKRGDRSNEAFRLAKKSIKYYKINYNRDFNKYNKMHETVFNNLKVGDLQAFLNQAKSTFEYVSDSRSTIKSIRDYAQQQISSSTTNPYINLAEQLLVNAIATLRLRKRAMTDILMLTSALVKIQYELITTAVIVTERASNPKYWK